MPMVFLSYRRDDSRADTGRLYDHLSREFGDDNVFMDVDDIAPGDNFVDKLESTLSQCDVLVAVIGPRWTTLAGAGGEPRLGDQDDFLTTEISTALKRQITLIPVLVGGAKMPAPSELPAALAALGRQQALSVRDERFRDDVSHLIAAIRDKPGSAAAGRRLPGRAAAAAGIAIALMCAAVAWFVFNGGDNVVLRSHAAVISVAQAKAMITQRDFYSARSNAGGQGGRHDYHSQVIGDNIVVVDKVTGLMWQKGAFSPQQTFEKALATLAQTNQTGFAGYYDWRIPTLEEAASLTSPEATGGYFLDPVFEVSAAPGMWTADTSPDGGRWVVWFSDAAMVPESAGFNAWMRLVRTRE